MQKDRPIIAIVDDEESVRRALARLLRASQMDAEAYASGEAFLASLNASRPDCVVLDLQMTGLTGRDVQRRLRAAQISLPVIIITAHDEPTIRQQCIADGAVMYLRKPLRGATLIRSIQNAIQHFTAPAAHC
jgi:FixJ family two-component response regulator